MSEAKKMKLVELHLGPIRTNCYLMIQTEKKEALIIDPGDGAATVAAKLTEEGVTPKAILLTHGHRDHIGAVPELRKHYGIPVYVGAEDQEMLGDADKNLSTGLFGKPRTLQADQLLKDKDHLELAGFSIQVFHTPGHTPGGCCFYFPEEQVLFSGDTLFCGSVGRTDFPGGSSSALVTSVRRLLKELPAETEVYPGHENDTSIEQERCWNPYA